MEKISKITIKEASGKVRNISKDICSFSEDGTKVTFTGKKIQDYLVFVVEGDKLIVDLEDGTREERVFEEDLLIESFSLNNTGVCEHCGETHKCAGIVPQYVRPRLMTIKQRSKA